MRFLGRLATVPLLVAAFALAGTAVGTTPTAGFPGNAQTDWAAAQYDAGRTSDNSHETSIGPVNVRRLHTIWHSTITFFPIRPAIVAAEHAVVITNQRQLVAFDAGTGRVRWRAAVPGQGHFQDSGIVVANGIVYTEVDDVQLSFGVGAAVAAFSLRTGKPIWERLFTGATNYFWGPPAYGDNRLYVINDEAVAFAFNPANGRLLWHHAYVLDRKPGFGFSYYNDRLYSTGIVHSKRIGVYSANSGRYLWSTQGQAVTYPVVRDGKIYAASGVDISAYPARCHFKVCRPLWTRADKNWSFLSATARLVIEATYDGSSHVAERSATTGRILWRTADMPFGQPTATIAGRVIYVTASDADRVLAYPLYGCGKFVCNPVWSRVLRSYHNTTTTTSAIAANGTLYVGANDSGVWAFRP